MGSGVGACVGFAVGSVGTPVGFAVGLLDGAGVLLLLLFPPPDEPPDGLFVGEGVLHGFSLFDGILVGDGFAVTSGFLVADGCVGCGTGVCCSGSGLGEVSVLVSKPAFPLSPIISTMLSESVTILFPVEPVLDATSVSLPVFMRAYPFLSVPTPLDSSFELPLFTYDESRMAFSGALCCSSLSRCSSLLSLLSALLIFSFFSSLLSFGSLAAAFESTLLFLSLSPFAFAAVLYAVLPLFLASSKLYSFGSNTL